MLAASSEVRVSVQGGGGKKIPLPAGASPPRPTSPPATQATPSAARSPAHDNEAGAAQGHARDLKGRDAFEAARARGGPEAHRVDEVIAHTTSPSGIANMVRMLTQARAQVLEEHGALRREAQAVFEQLVLAGFAPAQLDRARTELHAFRERLASQRERLQSLHRRLKRTSASAGKTGDANLARLLTGQLQRLRTLEPGLERAMLALESLHQVYGGPGDGSGIPLRLRLAGGAEERQQVGSALATTMPGATVAELSLRFLREGPGAASGAAAGAAAGASMQAPVPSALEGVRALVDALLPVADFSEE